MKKLRKSEGITLVALVITIIILLILAGLSISALTGSGLFGKAEEATSKYAEVQIKEQIGIAVFNSKINSAGNIALNELEKSLLEIKGVNNDNIEKQGMYEKLPWMVTVDELKFEINEDGEVNRIKEISISNIVESENKTTFSYTGSYQEYIVPENGYYKIECWGASGGNTGSYSGGKGAYTEGIIYLAKNSIIYIYVGGTGSSNGPNSARRDGGFNGGGGIGKTDTYSSAGSGGGATDIRLIGGESYNWYDFESLKSRIMVAAGGGGAATTNISGWGGASGGYGGTFIGGNGKCAHVSHIAPTGGTQTSGGLSTENTTNCKGQFGIGGNGSSGANGGGGGGYYGGGGAQYYANTLISGAGGSSFISGYDMCDSITSTSTEDLITHTKNSIHYCGKYFILSQMLAGNESMPSYNSSGTISGNTGNRICTNNSNNIKIKF